MGAAMNGLALHGGFIPYGGTFLIFSDYARGAIRLSALMRQQVVYVLTHDSIGLGEDGPTHQPVEHLAALRAMPNLLVFRPADAVETTECWQAALAHQDAPSVLALSRQALPALRLHDTAANLSALGGYVLRETDGDRDVTLIASGSEVETILAAADLLAQQGVHAAVVSLPCWELFERQSADYRRAVLGTAPRVGVEAALRFGWDRWIGENGAFVGMNWLRRFGAGAGTVQTFRHHRGSRRRRRESPAGLRRDTWPGSHSGNCWIAPPNAAMACRLSTSTTWSRASPSWRRRAPCNAPVIIQASRGARAYAGDIMLAKMMEALELTYPEIPLCIHQDHGDRVATCLSAIQNGFTSVMMDGSLKEDGKTPGRLRL